MLSDFIWIASYELRYENEQISIYSIAENRSSEINCFPHIFSGFKVKLRKHGSMIYKYYDCTLHYY